MLGRPVGSRRSDVVHVTAVPPSPTPAQVGCAACALSATHHFPAGLSAQVTGPRGSEGSFLGMTVIGKCHRMDGCLATRLEAAPWVLDTLFVRVRF